jgi:hypothetical protein
MSFSMEDVRGMIERCGLPGRNLYDLPASPLTFPDGAHWRNEASGISSLKLLETLIREMQHRGVPVHRVIYGMSGSAARLTRGELRDVAQMARDGRVEIVMECGVNAKTDVGSHVHVEGGARHGVRARGADQLAYQVASILRAIEAGIRGFLVRGEGLMLLLNKMRTNGDLPEDAIFKVSYAAGHANPAGAMLLEQIGADSFNPITDLELPMLAALRKACRIPMDIVVYAWPSLGSIKREWQAPEIVRVAAPCYLKQELYEDPVREARNCEILAEIVQRTYPELRLSQRGASDLRIPCPPAGA